MSVSKVSQIPHTTPTHHPWGKHMLLELLSEGLFFWMPARFACVLLLTWARKGGSGSINCYYWGASSPTDPLSGGLQPAVPPCSIFERLRLSSSPFFLVPRSWKPLTCGYVAAGAFFPQKSGLQILGSPQLVGMLPQALFVVRKMAPIFLEAPNLWVRCRKCLFFQRNGPHIFGSP